MRRAVLAWALVLLGLGLSAVSARADVQTTAPAVLAPPAGIRAREAPMSAAAASAPAATAPSPTTRRPGALDDDARAAVKDALRDVLKADALKDRPSRTLSGLPETAQTSEVVRIALVMTLLVLIPAVAICMTPFVRIVVVLSMIRHAFGMPETPPNQVLISLALFLTAFTMMPTLQAVNTRALEPFLAGSIPVKEAVDRGSEPVRTFMLRQVHDQDIKTVYDMARQPLPARAADVSLVNLTPAFMLNELRVSFKIGFVIFLPFLLIDIVVASVLLSLGMLMVPPATISLPIKILMFVLIDGWGLVLQSVVGSIR